MIRMMLRLIILIAISIILLGSSAVFPGEQVENIRAFTRDIEFDYVTWTTDALTIKLNQFALGVHSYLSPEDNHQLAVEYLDLIGRSQALEYHLATIYSDPEIPDPDEASADYRAELEELNKRRLLIAPFAESILQTQLTDIVAQTGLTLAGQPVPPVLFHSTALPHALIVSPRDEIKQDANISISPDLSVEEQIELEIKVDKELDVSSLVVRIGGIGVYPTMITRTSDINWLTEVIAHEWIHNFLSLRPLGVNYLTSPELRTMNETTAAIAGKEIGFMLMGKYYPELLPPRQEIEAIPADGTPDEPVFDFRAEMRTTRETVDQLLSEGRIDEAESYMEARRLFLWENGYQIRKLNQAYFAFHGAYADQPGGPAGEDPVGEAVRQLRAESDTLAEFINRMSWMTSVEQLQNEVSKSS